MHLGVLLSVFSLAYASSDCGIRHAEGGPSRYRRFILGGKNSSEGAWPWQVLLDVISHPNGVPLKNTLCGGAIISERWILTAAHCLMHHNEFEINAGLLYKNESDPMGQLEQGVTSVVIEAISHENFTAVIGEGDDIALLKLKTPLTFDGIMSPVCLPSADQEIADNMTVVATGFGYSGPDSRADNFRLRETTMPLVNIDECRARFEVSIRRKMADYPETMIDSYLKDALLFNGIICAGSSAHKVQNGDSGGPLVVKAIDGRWFQIGITSWGAGGPWVAPSEDDIVPEIFTDVRKYCGWIKETTGGEVGCQEEEVKLQDLEIPS